VGTDVKEDTEDSLCKQYTGYLRNGYPQNTQITDKELFRTARNKTGKSAEIS
jgi:hypothetical protein